MVSLLAGVLAARLLGPVARGELAAILLLPSIMAGIATFGAPQALTYYTAQEPDKAGNYLGAALAICTIGVTITSIVGWFLTPHVLAGSRPRLVTQALIYLPFFLFIATAYGVPWSVFLGSKDYRSFNFLRILPNVVYLIAVLVAFVHPDPVIITQVYIVLLGVVVLPMVWFTYSRRINQAIKIRIATIKHMWRYTSISAAMILPQIIGQRLELVFVVAKLDAATVGFYSVALGMGQILFTAQSAVGNILFPYLAAEKAVDKAFLFSRLLRITLLLTLFAVIGLVVVLPALLPLLFGDIFSTALVAAPILVVASGLSGINQVIGDGFRGLGRPGLPVSAESIGLFVKVVVLVIIYSKLDLFWAAIAGLSSPLAGFVFNCIAYHLLVSHIDVHWLGGFYRDLSDVWKNIMSRIGVLCLSK